MYSITFLYIIDCTAYLPEDLIRLKSNGSLFVVRMSLDRSRRGFNTKQQRRYKNKLVNLFINIRVYVAAMDFVYHPYVMAVFKLYHCARIISRSK